MYKSDGAKQKVNRLMFLRDMLSLLLGLFVGLTLFEWVMQMHILIFLNLPIGVAVVVVTVLFLVESSKKEVKI